MGGPTIEPKRAGLTAQRTNEIINLAVEAQRGERVLAEGQVFKHEHDVVGGHVLVGDIGLDRVAILRAVHGPGPPISSRRVNQAPQRQPRGVLHVGVPHAQVAELSEIRSNALKERLLPLVIAHVVGFWVLLFWVIHLRRQVRCLHFCFFGISDWEIDKLKDVADYYNAEYGREHSPFLDIEKQWERKIDFYLAMIKRAGVRVRQTTISNTAGKTCELARGKIDFLPRDD